MFSFSLHDDGINHNKGLDDSIRVLEQLLNDKISISADLCTEALRRELMLDPSSESLLKSVLSAETKLEFPIVESKFKIISADTRTVIVDSNLVKRIEAFEPVDWKEIQKHSVQIWGYRIEDLHIPELNRYPGVYAWNLEYSHELGIMKGILCLEDYNRNGGGII